MLLAVPAQASAACPPPGGGSAATPGTDTTLPSSTSWQRGTPAGSVTVTLSGSGNPFEYWVDCTTEVTGALPGDPVTLTGEGTHTLTHRGFDGLLWTDWVQDTVRI
ncbi:MAG TPA: hypothetical protein VFG79_22920, partial [Solirubrobacter sp.]|nr:hypothetical protein [Solirubrobacter sp.]